MKNKNHHIIKSKALPSSMKELLLKCYEKELKGQPPSDATLQHARGLITRGLVTVRPFINQSGKSLECIFISDAGKAVLDII